MGSLVTHVCSGVGGEVDVALELLCGLVNEKPSEMAMYAVFVKVTRRSKHCSCKSNIQSKQRADDGFSYPAVVFLKCFWF